MAKQTFADELKTFRETHGLNLPEMADIIHVSERTLWGWENGDAPSKIKELGARYVMERYAPGAGKKKIAKAAK